MLFHPFDKSRSDLTPYMIAEVGFNHEGDKEAARRMIKAAAAAGADAVKFQTFRASDLALPDAPHFQLIRSGEMSLDDHKALAETAEECGLRFLSTPFSEWAVDILEEVGVPAYKIASMDLTNHPLLAYVAQTRKPVILSTGMATLAEIGESIEFLASKGAHEIVLLHCISEYPATASDMNLRAIPFLGTVFGVPTGYSDHFPGSGACLAAAMLGAQMIETHFTLDKTKPGGDHAHSLDPDDLRRLIEDIKLFEAMRGSEHFFGHRPDRRNAAIFRRGLYAGHDLAPGAPIQTEDLLSCRPVSELGPNDMEWLMGRPVRRPVKLHSALTRSDV